VARFIKREKQNCQINYRISQREESFGLRLDLEKKSLATATKKHLHHGENIFAGDSRV
jgi:hypothetical protein